MAPKTIKPAAESAAQPDATASAVTTSETTQIPPVVGLDSKSGSDSEAGSQPQPPKDAPFTASEPGMVMVVVRPKRTIKHEGETHSETALVELPDEDAERLKKMGFVDYFDDLKEIAKASRGVKVSSNSAVVITQEF